MAYKSNIGVNPRVFYTLIGGDDQQAGTSLETAKATIQGSIDAVNALVPPVNVLNRATILISGSGIFLENITFPEFTNYDARDITNTVSSGGTYVLNSSSSYNVGLSVVSTIAGVIFGIAGKSIISLICSSANVVGASGSAVLLTALSDDIFIRIEKLRLTGIASIGINHNATNGEPEVIVLGAVTLEANDTIGVMYNGVSGARSIVEIGSIAVIAPATGTTAIRVLDGHLSVFCGEIIAAIALEVQAGTLSYIGSTVTGNINVSVGATLNVEIAEFSGIITNNGTIVGRIGTQTFGAGFVTATGTLTNDTLTRGNGGLDIESAAHLTVPNNQLNLQILANNDTGIISIKDELAADKITLSYDDSSGVSSFLFPDGITFSKVSGGNTPFMTWDTTPGANGTTSRIFLTSDNPEGVINAFESFAFRTGAAFSDIFIKRSPAGSTVDWAPVVTGPNNATNTNKFMTWGDGTGSLALDNTILTYVDAANKFVDFNHGSANIQSGFRWFDFGGGTGPTILYDSLNDSLNTLNFPGTIATFSGSIIHDIADVAGFITASSVANDGTQMFRWVRTGTSGADINLFIASTSPSGGGDGDISFRQDTTNTGMFINVNALWQPMVTGQASGSTDNRLMLWNGTSGNAAKDTSIITYMPGTNNFLDFNNASAAAVTGIRWFRFGGAGGPLFTFTESISTVSIQNFGGTVLTNAMFHNLNVTTLAGLVTFNSISNVATEILRLNRTGTNPADVSIFVSNTTPSGIGGDGDLAVEQNGASTDLFINVNGVWTGLLASGGAGSLAATLAVGNVTGGNDLSISNGDSLVAVGGETTGTVIDLSNLNSLSTGVALDITSASSDAAARDLVRIINDDPGAAFVTLLRIRDDSLAVTSSAIDCTGQTFFDTNTLPVNAIGFSIDCDNTTGAATVFDINANTSIATGTTVASIAQNQFAATTTTTLSLVNMSTGAGSLVIDAAGNTSFAAVSTSGNANFFDLDNITDGIGVRITGDQLTTGASLFIDSNAPSAGARDLVNIQNLNASATAARCLSLTQFSTAPIAQLIRSGADLDIYADNVSGDGNITGNPGDVNFVDSGANSNIEVNFGTVANSNRWGSCLGGPALILFGSASVATTTTLRFLYPGYSSIVAQTADIAMRMTRPGFLRNMFVGQNVGAGNGNDIVYTVHFNDVATALSVTMSSLVVNGSNTSAIVEVGPDDEISVRVTKAAGIGSSPLDIVVSIDYI